MNTGRSIRDVVAPFISGTWSAGDFRYEQLEGTLFLIGTRGFAITAAHVLDQVSRDFDNSAAAFVNNENRWVWIKIVAGEKHSLEDVAVLQLETPLPWPSWLTITASSEHSSCEYDAWGYPRSIAKSAATFEEAGLERPELIYTRGYVRRRISRELPISIFRGSSFYELNQQAGEGCSGGPVIMRSSIGQPMWKVCGVYVGEAASTSVAYAVRTDSFHSWEPQIVGRSILAESEG